jgi:hypothetical protein
MDRRTLIALIIATLISCIGYAGESGYFLNLRGATDTYRMPLYLYREDVEVATAPLLVVQLGGRARYGRLIPSSSATASEPFRVKYSDIFISDVFTLSATSPYSIEYTDEKYFTFDGNLITGYNTTFGPSNVIVPPFYIGPDAFRNLTLASIDVSHTYMTYGQGYYAFAYSTIASITVPATWDIGQELREGSGQWRSSGEYCFLNCMNLTSMTILGSHEVYPAGFAKNAPLTQLIIPPPPFGSASEIGWYAFNGATRVTFEGEPSDYTWDITSFKEPASLGIAFTTGGSGTYVFNVASSTWTKE